MYLEKITTTWQDYPSNSDIAILVYLQGCTNDCIDCHNKELQNINKDNEIDSKMLYEKIKDQAIRNKTNKVVFQGGDPLSKYNINGLKTFLSIYCKEFDICIYTGYGIDYVMEHWIIGFKYIKCGRYDNKLLDKKHEIGKTDKQIVFASTNQKLYDSHYNCISKNNVYKF